MKLEQLSTNKIRITLSVDELKDSNINIHSFMSNSKETQDLFFNILLIAQEEFNFSTKNYKISYETLYLNNNCFIINITRFKNSRSENKSHLNTEFITGPKFFIFKSIDDFLDFYIALTDNKINFLSIIECSLYFLNNKYYLKVNYKKIDSKYIILFNYLILEFAEVSSTLTSNEIIENSNCLSGNIFLKNKKGFSK